MSCYPGNESNNVVLSIEVFHNIESIAMNVLKAPIDYEELEQELHDALRAEELYNLQNDAKFRAIEQAVPTYEDFRGMVNAAHLKSLDRKDMTPKIGVQWNSAFNDKPSSHPRKQRSITLIGQQPVREFSSSTTPRNTHEFRQAWKRLTNSKEKYEFLKRTRLAFCNTIFRSEIPPEILNEIILVCMESLESLENINSITQILKTLSKCNRFQLAVAFMSDNEKSVCKQLFQKLQVASAKIGTIDSINDLKKSYVSSNE